MRVLLDTHILVYWCLEPERLSPPQQHALSSVAPEEPAVVADITLWEISALCSAGKLRLDLPLRDWLTQAVAPPLVRVAEISPCIAETVSKLSSWDNKDPADRLIVATALSFGARLVSNDRRMRDAGLVDVV